MTAAPSPLLLSYPDANPTFDWQSLSQAERQRPITITIGTLGKTTDGIAKLESLTSPQLNLVHFRCYGLSALQELPELPFGLISLDLQHLPSPTTLPDLPRGLLRLTLIGLTSLRDLREIPRMEELRVLTLKGLPMLSSNSINLLLQAAPHLKQLRLQGCGSLENITQWPPELEAIWLEDSPVTKVPETWPSAGPLQTVSLKGCDRLTSDALPSPETLPLSVSMVNLAGCRALTRLPFPEDRQPFPHTLHLSGSGLLRPLKSQHGADAETNVAAETQRYFSALRLLDTRVVHRCKILILGNGRAGKTFLTRALLGRKVTAAENNLPDHQRPPELRSTHGIQFHPWPGFVPTTSRRQGEDQPSPHVHLWDFGGQELYHNTHQLFVRSGCLFVLVWNPDQDGQPAPVDAATGMQDVWRPLAYWFHLIRHASEFADTARILLVHAHRPSHTRDYPHSELDRHWKAQAGELADRVSFFPVNSLDDGAQPLNLPELVEELKTQTGRVIDAQGTAVPAHWDIALQMVEEWVNDPAYQQMRVARFREELVKKIRKTLDKRGREFPKLKKAWNRTFRLDDDDVRDTLRFLTHSGWAFWHEDRMPDTVIIGQKWAMEGIYAFTRREGTLSEYLERSGGLIRSSQVSALNWGSPQTGNPYTKQEHQILFGYAESCGVIFPLKNREESFDWNETVYAVHDRLPKKAGQDWALPPGTPTESGTELPLTRAPWNLFLEECGKTFGTSARYAQSAFRVETGDGQEFHATFDLRANGIHADVTVQASTPELAKQVFARITQAGGGGGEALHTFKAKSARTVFISYAWNIARPGFDPPGTLNLDALGPVDAITAYFDPMPGLHLIRDDRSMQPGDSIPQFISGGIKSERILCVFSERYFYRPWCLLELGEILKRVNNDSNEFFKLVTPVLIGGVTFTADDTDRRKDFWNKKKNIQNAKFPKGWNINSWRDVRTRFDNIIHVIGDLLGSAILRRAVSWNPGDKDGSLQAIRTLVEG